MAFLPNAGNVPGEFSTNVRPPMRGLPPAGQLSRTREEANMSVRTALIPGPKDPTLSSIIKRKCRDLSRRSNRNNSYRGTPKKMLISKEDEVSLYKARCCGFSIATKSDDVSQSKQSFPLLPRSFKGYARVPTTNSQMTSTTNSPLL